MRDDLDSLSTHPQPRRRTRLLATWQLQVWRAAIKLPAPVADSRGEFIAGAAAAGVFLLLVFPVAMPMWLAVPLAAASYAGAILVRPRSPQDTGAHPIPEASGPHDATVVHGKSLSPLSSPTEQSSLPPPAPVPPDVTTSRVSPPDDLSALLLRTGPDEQWQVFSRAYGLTKRELEVVPLLARRLTDREIADRLFLSPRTAMNHAANVLGKLGLKSRRDVAALLKAHGLVVPDDDAPVA